MHFSISHDFDATVDTIELVILSSELPERILGEIKKSTNGPRIESVETVEHTVDGGGFRRVLRYQAAAPSPAIQRLIQGRRIDRDMLAWRESFDYAVKRKVAAWKVSPLGPYERYFAAHGDYRLEGLPNGRTRRTVEGDLDVRVRLIGPLLERIALAEVKKTYDAEAAALRGLAVL